MISLKEYVSQAETPPNKVLKVRVLSCSGVESYTNAAGQQCSMFNATVADGTSFAIVKCYDAKQVQKFTIDAGLMILNSIRHPSHIALTVKSIVALTAVPDVPDSIRNAAKTTPTDSITSITDALHAPATSLTTNKRAKWRKLRLQKKEWLGNCCNLQVLSGTIILDSTLNMQGMH